MQAGAQVTGDTASLLQNLPGASLNYNGPLAGQVQYRGLYGPSNNVLVDGMHIDPGGPNWMDPPLHYLPRPFVDSISVQRGIAPVADGIETLGATVNATSRETAFTTTPGYRLQGYGMAGYDSVDHGFVTGAMLGVAGQSQRVDIMVARSHGDDTRTPDGTLAATGFDRNNVALDYGARWGANTLDASFLYDDTGPSGNPTLPMDTQFLHSGIGNLRFSHRMEDGRIDAQLYYVHVDHAMNNYMLRPTPDFNPMMPGPDERRIPANSDEWGLNTDWVQNVGAGTLTSGFDVQLARHDARVTDPQVPMFGATLFDHATRNLYSIYSQWQAPVATSATLMLGARLTRVHTDAGDGYVSAMLPAPAHMLTQAFNASDRAKNDNNLDLMGRLDVDLDAAHVLEFSLARKTRSPSYLERYAYIPLEASAGLADGNNYVGNVNLKPEVAYQADVGIAWLGPSFSFTPRVFLYHIQNYITGLPVDPTASPVDKSVVMVSTLNGDPTPLRFSNVDAQLYGADASLALRFTQQWRLEVTATWTRGLRAGSDDNLYRIAPLHGYVQLLWQPNAWQFGLGETVSAAQHDISAANYDPRLQDPRTAGYALTDLSARYASADGNTTFALGVGNLFDRRYTSILDGYNRVMDSSVPVGTRLPGAARNFYVQVTRKFE